jgi:hypothetical protein
MAAYPQPNLVSFRAGGTIVKGHAVKIGADAKHVIESTATTDKTIGVAMNAASSGDAVEVAIPGGGAEVVAQTTITSGQQLVSHTDGTLKPAAAGNDRVLAIALDAAVAGDFVPVIVSISQATTTEA